MDRCLYRSNYLSKYFIYKLFSPPKSNAFILDSETTNHFGTNDQLNSTKKPCTTVLATLPNNNHILSIHVVDLPFKLPSKARKCYILPQLHTSLLSIDQFCDSDSTVIFRDDAAFVLNNNHHLTSTINKLLRNNTPIITAIRD